MKRTRRSDYGEQSWWTQDHGGLPGWAIVGVVLVVLALGFFIGMLMLNPR